MKKVVIVGGGFGGVKTALELAGDPNFEVTLISNRTCFEYHAALYRSATGRSVLEVVLPLSEVFAQHTDVTLSEDTIEGLDNQKQIVTGASGATYHYDSLVLALGNVTQYFGITGLDTFSYGIKSIDEALRLKRHLHEQMSNHQNIDRHYVVVGAGPTGVELAAELQSYLKRLYRKHKARNRTFQIDLVEAAPTALPSVPGLAKPVQRRLERMGIKLYLNTSVKGETASKLKLPHGSIETHTVVWTAGVTNNPLFVKYQEKFRLGKGNRVEVNDLLAAPNIYVIGDGAATEYSGMAQTALYDAHFVAKVLRGGKLPYRPPKPIAAVPVGPKWCAVAIGPLRLYGYPGWLIRRYLDLKLYSNLLPPAKALSTWLKGNREQESCPICGR